MKLLVTISRILVGFLFIVSGLIKANDTVGFGFKLEEYFSSDVLNMPFLIPYATGLAALICVAEILLGVATLMGGKMKITSWALLLLIVFFTFLTFYSAYFNKVTDCGCFGDAIKLTPWQSFTKDVVLLVFTLIIFIRRNYIQYNTLTEDKIILPIAFLCVMGFSVGMLRWHFPWIFTLKVLAVALLIKYLLMKNKPTEWTVAIFTTIISSVFCYYTYAYLPIKDFRAYKIGTNILKGMEIPANAEPDVYKTLLYYSKNGEVKEFTTANYPWNDSTWVWKETKNILVKKGYRPPIHDFSINDVDGNDYAQEFLSESSGYTFMLVAYDLKKANMGVQPKISEFAARCEKAGIRFFGITGASAAETDIFRHEVTAMYPYYFCDKTALKTIIRSNPGLVLIKNGTVLAMWHYNNFPKFDEIKAKFGF